MAQFTNFTDSKITQLGILNIITYKYNINTNTQQNQKNIMDSNLMFGFNMIKLETVQSTIWKRLWELATSFLWRSYTGSKRHFRFPRPPSRRTAPETSGGRARTGPRPGRRTKFWQHLSWFGIVVAENS